MKRVQSVLRLVCIACAENVRTIAVIVGMVLCYYGIAGLSRSVANIALGTALVVAGLYPYMRAHN
jgi:hypothetical protein